MKMRDDTECVAQSATRSESLGFLQQYGALPWRRSKRGKLKILLITSRERGRWILPKGWPMKGKTPAQAAAQEAFEEAGVIGDPGPEAIGEYTYVKMLRDGSSADCSVILFGLHVHNMLINWPESTQRTRRWFTIAEAAETVSDGELGQVLRRMQGDLDVLR